MEMIKQLLNFFRKLNKAIMYISLFFLVSGLSYAVWDVYQTAPRFLFTLDEQLLSDPNVLKTIGEKRGTAYTYADHVLAEGDSAVFSCTITGRCDSSYVRISGVYYNRNNRLIGVVTDTVMKASCL